VPAYEMLRWRAGLGRVESGGGEESDRGERRWEGCAAGRGEMSGIDVYN
jgi:hypothetical protein